MMHHQRLLDRMTTPIATTDLQGRVLVCNKAWRQWLARAIGETNRVSLAVALPELKWIEQLTRIRDAADPRWRQTLSRRNAEGQPTLYQLQCQLTDDKDAVDILVLSEAEHPELFQDAAYCEQVADRGVIPSLACGPCFHRLQDLEDIIHALDDWVIEVDTDGVLLNVWTSPEKKLGFFSLQALKGSQLQDFFQEDLAEKLLMMIHRCLDQQSLQVIEAPYDHTQLLWYRWKLIPVRSSPIVSGRVVILIQEISEHVVSQQQMLRSEQKIRRLLEASPDLKVLVNSRGILTYLSSTNLGVKLGFRLGASLTSMAAEAHVLRDRLQRARETGTSDEFEMQLSAADTASSLWLHVRIVSLGQDENAQLLVLRDITAERRQKQTIRILTSVIDASPDCIVICDHSGRIEYLNRSAREMFQHRSHVRQLMNGEQYERLKTQVWPIVQKGQSWAGEMMLDSSIQAVALPVWQRVFALKETEVELELIALVGSDLRLRKTLEAQLIQSSKMVSLGEMAGGLAHEINNPLAIILGKVTQIRRMSSGPQACLELVLQELHHIEGNAERITKIIGGLRSFARDAAKDPFQARSMRQLIEETLDLCQERFHALGIDLHVELEEDGVLMCRPAQIQEVLFNILHNAYDAVIEKPQNLRHVAIVSSRLVDRLQIAISDSGAGIPPQCIDRIMEPFFTTKDIGKGTGLGLSIAKGIIDDHGGRLFVDRQAPLTRFIVELPLSLPDALTQAHDSHRSTASLCWHPGA